SHKLGEWKTPVWNEDTNQIEMPNGSQGFRRDDGNKGNTELGKEDGSVINPQLQCIEEADERSQVKLPYLAEGEGGAVKRGVPVKYTSDIAGNKLMITTVYDLMMAHVGVDRQLAGDYPADYDDPKPYTPAWQESITGVNKNHVIQIAKEFADNSART